MVLLALALCAVVVVESQEPTLDTSPIAVKRKPQKPKPGEAKPGNANDASQASNRSSFVVAPIPTSSPAVGNGATILGAYIFQLRKSDTVSRPSLVGGAWVGTDNGTRAWVGATELYFNRTGIT